MTIKERRKSVRFAVDIPTEFIVQGRLYQGQIKNINKEGRIRIGNVNKGGVFIKTETSFSVGQKISMRYHAFSFEEKKRPGKIIWVGPEGFGVEFN